ncbi:MAG: glycosyltransferase [Kiritimatiellia bacterium]
MTAAAIPRVSVIVPVRDDAGRLQLCLAALSAQTVAPDAFEVVVVDNGSTRDDPAAVVRLFPFARLVFEGKPGASAARNGGLAAAGGGVLAFTDADCLPAPEWLERGLAALKETNAALVAGRVEVFPREPGRPSALELFDMAHSFDQRLFVERWHFGATANLFVRRAAADALGGFNEAIPYYGEDVDFGRRAGKAGFAIRYAADAVVRHPARFEWRAFRDRLERTMRAAYGSAEPGLRRLLLDVWHGWPAWRDVIRAPSLSFATRPGDRLKLALVTAWVKGWRTFLRVELFWEQVRKPKGVTS